MPNYALVYVPPPGTRDPYTGVAKSTVYHSFSAESAVEAEKIAQAFLEDVKPSGEFTLVLALKKFNSKAKYYAEVKMEDLVPMPKAEDLGPGI